LVVNEFTDINGCKDGICDVPKRDMSFTNSVGSSLIVLFVLASVSRILAAIMFHLNYRKFSQAN